MLLHEHLLMQAAQHPEKTAVKTAAGNLTYAEFQAGMDRLARKMIQYGLQRGDRVLIYMDNSLETCIAIYATLLAGGVFICINPTTKVDKLIYLLNDSKARLLITQSNRRLQLGQIRTLAPALTHIIIDHNLAGDGSDDVLPDILSSQLDSVPLPRLIDVDLAALIYTSGSTGNPKGVMMTHLNMVSAVHSITTYLENAPGDIVLNVLPLSFDYGLYQLLMTMSFGGTLILEKDFTYPQLIVQRLIEEKITGFPGVPTVFAMLFNLTGWEKYQFPHLRYISNTGAALPVTFIDKLRKAFPGTTIFSMYGLTECKRVAFLPPQDIERKPQSVGRAMPNCETFIVDDEGHRLPFGQIGELVVRGANVMQGYWNRPEETLQVLRTGVHPYERVLYTGDLFREDEEGYLYFVGRKDDIIKCRGEKVSPREIENILYQMPGIEEAAVIGWPDTVLGQAIKAFVTETPQAHLDVRDVLRHCATHLENYAVPQEVIFLSEMPKSSNGKIDKKQIFAMYTR